MGPGDVADPASAAIERAQPPASGTAVLESLVAALAREGRAGRKRGLQLRHRIIDGATASIDLEGPRDERG